MPLRNTFLICTRAVDKAGKFTCEPDKTTYLRVAAKDHDYSTENSLTRARWTKAVIAAADGDEDEITGAKGNILFFVHGYANDREMVLWRTRILQETLAQAGWKGIVIGFDWPSENSTLNYLEDRSDAAAVARSLIDDALRILVEALAPQALSEEPCKLNVHLLGHSTGAFVIMEAFANAEKSSANFRTPWRLEIGRASCRERV